MCCHGYWFPPNSRKVLEHYALVGAVSGHGTPVGVNGRCPARRDPDSTFKSGFQCFDEVLEEQVSSRPLWRRLVITASALRRMGQLRFVRSNDDTLSIMSSQTTSNLVEMALES